MDAFIEADRKQATPLLKRLVVADMLGNQMGVHAVDKLADAAHTAITLCGIAEGTTELDLTRRNMGTADLRLLLRDLSRIRERRKQAGSRPENAVSRIDLSFNPICGGTCPRGHVLTPIQDSDGNGVCNVCGEPRVRFECMECEARFVKLNEGPREETTDWLKWSLVDGGHMPPRLNEFSYDHCRECHAARTVEGNHALQALAAEMAKPESTVEHLRMEHCNLGTPALASNTLLLDGCSVRMVLYSLVGTKGIANKAPVDLDLALISLAPWHFHG